MHHLVLCAKNPYGYFSKKKRYAHSSYMQKYSPSPVRTMQITRQCFTPPEALETAARMWRKRPWSNVGGNKNADSSLGNSMAVPRGKCHRQDPEGSPQGRVSNELTVACQNQAWGCTPVTPAIERLRQELLKVITLEEQMNAGI